MSDKQLVLKIEKLRKSYLDSDHEVLKGISLELYKGDFLCILGPSGCGKTSLIRCIAGFEDYTGIIECNGNKVSRPETSRIMVFQDFNQLFPWMTVLNNIVYALKIKGLGNKRNRVTKARELLDIVNLSEYESFYPHQLSGGMKQRVAIARALAMQPQLVLMDEPFAALDAISRNNMQKELLRIKENTGMTIIFVTHNIQESLTLGNRIIVMGRGGVLNESLVNMLERPVTPATEGYGKLWLHLNEALSE